MLDYNILRRHLQFKMYKKFPDSTRYTLYTVELVTLPPLKQHQKMIMVYVEKACLHFKCFSPITKKEILKTYKKNGSRAVDGEWFL